MQNTGVIEELQGRRSQTPCSLPKEDKSGTGNSGENTRFQKVWKSSQTLIKPRQSSRFEMGIQGD